MQGTGQPASAAEGFLGGKAFCLPWRAQARSTRCGPKEVRLSAHREGRMPSLRRPTRGRESGFETNPHRINVLHDLFHARASHPPNAPLGASFGGPFGRRRGRKRLLDERGMMGRTTGNRLGHDSVLPAHPLRRGRHPPHSAAGLALCGQDPVPAPARGRELRLLHPPAAVRQEPVGVGAAELLRPQHGRALARRLRRHRHRPRAHRGPLPLRRPALRFFRLQRHAWRRWRSASRCTATSSCAACCGATGISSPTTSRAASRRPRPSTASCRSCSSMWGTTTSRCT